MLNCPTCSLVSSSRSSTVQRQEMADFLKTSEILPAVHTQFGRIISTTTRTIKSPNLSKRLVIINLVLIINFL